MRSFRVLRPPLEEAMSWRISPLAPSQDLSEKEEDAIIFQGITEKRWGKAVVFWITWHLAQHSLHFKETYGNEVSHKRASFLSCSWNQTTHQLKLITQTLYTQQRFTTSSDFDKRTKRKKKHEASECWPSPGYGCSGHTGWRFKRIWIHRHRIWTRRRPLGVSCTP